MATFSAVDIVKMIGLSRCLRNPVEGEAGIISAHSPCLSQKFFTVNG